MHVRVISTTDHENIKMGDKFSDRDCPACIVAYSAPCRRWRLVYNLIGATAAGKSFRFGFEGKAHSQDIAHSFFQRVIALEMRVGVNVRMYFHFYIINSEQIA